MNNKINELTEKLASIHGNEMEIEAELQTEYNKVFEAMPEIKAMVASVESSTEYSWDKYGEIVSWSRADLSAFDDIREYFKAYMQEYHFVGVDFQNDCVTYSQGHNIIINEDGDVLDQDGNKWFLKRSDYLDDDRQPDETKRNQLIEEYMEKTGYFPGVFSADRYGNIFHVKTNKS